MAHQDLTTFALASSLAVSLGACGEAAPTNPPPCVDQAQARPGACGSPMKAAPTAASFSDETPEHMQRFHSKRFAVSVPLPDGRAWRIDDHTRPELFATHAPTSSKLVVSVFAASSLVNRRECEDMAREKKLVPSAELRTVEEGNVMAPEMFDTRVWVALEPSPAPSRPLVGHVMAFGGFLRKCIFFHYWSEVASAKDEAALSSRLALARTRMFGGLTVDAFAEPPREHGP